MSLFDEIMNSQNGAPVQQMARKFGVGESDVGHVLKQFLPALTNGMKRNVTQNQGGGLEGLLGALSGGRHQRYLDDADSLTNRDAVNEGNSILGHVLGGKDVSRELANRASQSTGMDSGMLKQMLPLVANMVMGAMSKQGQSNGMLGMNAGAQQANALNPMMSMLDADGDGSVIDDVLGLAAKFLR